MNIIEKYSPLNTEEAIKALVDELLKIPGAMNPTVRMEIYMTIQKNKLQKFFNRQYPATMFPDTQKFIPKAEENTKPTDTNGGDNTDDYLNQYNKALYYLPQETLTDKRSVYGTYIEMAFHNLYLTMHHINLLVFGTDLMSDATKYFNKNNKQPNKYFDGDFGNEWALWNPMFEKMENAKAEQKARLDELFRKHFPFLKAIEALKPSDKETCLSILKKFSIVLRELRNCYSHFLYIPYANQEKSYTTNIKKLFKLMDILYLGAKREVKARFAFTDAKMECAEMYKNNTDKNLRDEKGNMLKIVEKSNFKYKLYKTNKDNSKERIITPFGLLFLSSLFLEKKYSKIMSDKTHCIRYADSDVICEMISVYRIRLHIQKLTVTKSADALALDIINELQRCPMPLFEMLKPEEQQMFRIKPESAQDPEVLMVRKRNRFAHLLLKYIDDTKLFEHIRFHVSLGRYFFRFYDKRCIDFNGETHVRAICKDVNGFGRITEIEELRKSEWGNLIRDYDGIHANTADEKPYVTDHHAQYLIENNKIGLYNRSNKDNSELLPKLNAEGAANISPTCWLSTYELPALAFLLHLHNGDGARVEDIIRSHVGHYQRLFADIRDGNVTPLSSPHELVELLKNYGGIAPENLPSKMLDYLLAKEVDTNKRFQQWAQSYLKQLITQTDNLEARFKRDQEKIAQNKFGKSSFVTIKTGKIADFLAHDMMFFQPFTATNRNKLTGLNFRILQSVLATYNGNIDELRRVLTAAHIIGNAGDDLCNPIVKGMRLQANRINSITDFYLSYLAQRRIYLKRCLNESNYSALCFLHSQQARWNERNQEYYRNLAARYLVDEYGGTKSSKAIELPRGLFEPYIRQELSKMPEMKDLANDTTKNTAYLIYGYFRNVIGDDSQVFYDSKRSYQLFNVLDKDNKPVYFNTEQIRKKLMNSSADSFRKAIAKHIGDLKPDERNTESERCQALLRKMKKTETELKVCKIQDILLFLVAKRILLNKQINKDSMVDFQAIDKICLHDIANGDVLSQKISLKVTVTSKNGYSKVLQQTDIKLKNYSQFYATISDRRLPSLLDLVQERVIQRSVVENELDNYDTEHPNVIKSIFEFEKNYYKDNKDDIPQGVIPDLGDMLRNSNLPQSDQFDVRAIRNSFAHLIYPNYNVAKVNGVDMPQKAKNIANRLINNLKSGK